MTKSVSPKGPAYIAINHITHRGPPLSPFFFLSFVLSFLTPLGALIRNNARVFFFIVYVSLVYVHVYCCASLTHKLRVFGSGSRWLRNKYGFVYPVTGPACPSSTPLLSYSDSICCSFSQETPCVPHRLTTFKSKFLTV